jgi:hypothetical protein
MRARWLVVAVVFAVVALLATLYLRVVVVQTAILFPYGDVPGLSGVAAESERTLYVEPYGSATYLTVPMMGRGVLSTNTTGWYALGPLTRAFGVPAVSLAVLPAAGSAVNFSVSVGLVGYDRYSVWNYNGTHGAVIMRDPYGFAWAWAAAIVRTAGGMYVWHPVVPDVALRYFVAWAAGGPVRLFVPSADYLSIESVGGDLYYCVWYDYWNGTAWLTRHDCYSYWLGKFTPLQPGTDYLFDGLERVALPDGTLAYLYWPTLAYFSAQNITAPFVTYLKAAAR